MGHVIKNDNTPTQGDNHITFDWYDETFLRRGDTQGEIGTVELQIPIRLTKTIDTGTPETIVILEVPEDTIELLEATVARVSFARLQRDEAVVGIGYSAPEGIPLLTYAVGNYRPPQVSTESSEKSSEPYPLYQWFEMTNLEGENRLVLDHGASGGPIFNCRGQVVAVVNNVLTQNGINMGPIGSIRIPTAWGHPTNTAVFSLDLGEPLPRE